MNAEEDYLKILSKDGANIIELSGHFIQAPKFKRETNVLKEEAYH